jgi:hypothetical protein
VPGDHDELVGGRDNRDIAVFLAGDSSEEDAERSGVSV